MATKEEMKELAKTGERFGAALERWGKQAERTALAQGAPGVGQVIAKLTVKLPDLVSRLWRKVMEFAERLGLFEIAGELGAFVEMGIGELLGVLEDVLGELEAGAAAAVDTVIGAVLGIVEAIKKIIHLVLDRVKMPPVTEPIEGMLDILDNILGNIAELVSPKAGKLARTFRTNMYGQLRDIRAAKAGMTVPELDREEPA